MLSFIMKKTTAEHAVLPDFICVKTVTKAAQ